MTTDFGFPTEAYLKWCEEQIKQQHWVAFLYEIPLYDKATFIHKYMCSKYTSEVIPTSPPNTIRYLYVDDKRNLLLYKKEYEEYRRSEDSRLHKTLAKI